MTPEKVAIVQDADAIWREEIAKAGLDKEINQYYAALTNMRSVGVMGDERTYDYAVALRAVTTTDFMTAESYNVPWDVLGTVTSRIVNESSTSTVCSTIAPVSRLPPSSSSKLYSIPSKRAEPCQCALTGGSAYIGATLRKFRRVQSSC